jgi:hypothetical protein
MSVEDQAKSHHSGFRPAQAQQLEIYAALGSGHDIRDVNVEL